MSFYKIVKPEPEPKSGFEKLYKTILVVGALAALAVAAYVLYNKCKQCMCHLCKQNSCDCYDDDDDYCFDCDDDDECCCDDDCDCCDCDCCDDADNESADEPIDVEVKTEE